MVQRSLAPVVLLIAACTSTPTAEDTWASVLTGTWGWSTGELGCESNPHTIVFSSDENAMDLQFATAIPGPDGTLAKAYRYEILSVSRSSARMRVIGETRTTSGGDLVVWDLVMLSRNDYCWHRTDWPSGACTDRIERCR